MILKNSLPRNRRRHGRELRLRLPPSSLRRRRRKKETGKQKNTAIRYERSTRGKLSRSRRFAQSNVIKRLGSIVANIPSSVHSRSPRRREEKRTKRWDSKHVPFRRYFFHLAIIIFLIKVKFVWLVYRLVFFDTIAYKCYMSDINNASARLRRRGKKEMRMCQSRNIMAAISESCFCDNFVLLTYSLRRLLQQIINSNFSAPFSAQFFLKSLFSLSNDVKRRLVKKKPSSFDYEYVDS